MLNRRKPNLANLHEWGEVVWVHTTEGNKLEGQAKTGQWIGFDKINNGHRIYWPKRKTVTVERSIRFSNDDVIFLSNATTMPIQGESEQSNYETTENPKNPQHDRDQENKSTTSTNKAEEHTYDTQETPQTSEETEPNESQWRYAPFNRVTDELVAARS